jgi:hypothetical protein
MSPEKSRCSIVSNCEQTVTPAFPRLQFVLLERVVLDASVQLDARYHKRTSMAESQNRDRNESQHSHSAPLKGGQNKVLDLCVDL